VPTAHDPLSGVWAGTAPMTRLDPVSEALHLAGEGFACFPCGRDKAPTRPRDRGGRGFKDASVFEHRLRWLWRQFPGPLIGVATGLVSGIDALDIDGKHAEARAWWAENRKRFPQTRTHRTRSGGLHLFFVANAERHCSVGKIARGIDTRCAGGYVIWWPAAGFPVLCEGPISPWPSWLKPREPERIVVSLLPRKSEGLSPYAEAALDSACRKIMAASDGEQEGTLNGEAFAIGRLAGAGGIPEAFARRALLWAAKQIPSYDPSRPWHPAEIEWKVNRAFDDGVRHPREAQHAA
jgi:hypothetical protein